MPGSYWSAETSSYGPQERYLNGRRRKRKDRKAEEAYTQGRRSDVASEFWDELSAALFEEYVKNEWKKKSRRRKRRSESLMKG